MKWLLYSLLLLGNVNAQSPPYIFNPPIFAGTIIPSFCNNGALFYNVSTYQWSICGPVNAWNFILSSPIFYNAPFLDFAGAFTLPSGLFPSTVGFQMFSAADDPALQANTGATLLRIYPHDTNPNAGVIFYNANQIQINQVASTGTVQIGASSYRIVASSTVGSSAITSMSIGEGLGNAGAQMVMLNFLSANVPTAGVQLQLGQFFETLFTPASSSSTCSTGTFTDDINFHYVCVTTNTWKRVALSTF